MNEIDPTAIDLIISNPGISGLVMYSLIVLVFMIYVALRYREQKDVADQLGLELEHSKFLVEKHQLIESSLQAQISLIKNDGTNIFKFMDKLIDSEIAILIEIKVRNKVSKDDKVLFIGDAEFQEYVTQVSTATIAKLGEHMKSTAMLYLTDDGLYKYMLQNSYLKLFKLVTTINKISLKKGTRLTEMFNETEMSSDTNSPPASPN